MDIQDQLLFHSFLQIKGISPKKERAYWKNGIRSLSQLDEVRNSQQSLFADENEESASIYALERADAAYFLDRLKQHDYYRIAYSFPEDVMFLDIETTGLSTVYHYVTLIGWMMNGKYNYWLQGTNPKKFWDAVRSAKMIVTFNGKRFDCKFLDHAFQTDYFSQKPNLDLMHFCRRFRLVNGQKEIEQRTNFLRPESLKETDGKEAIALWYRFLFGQDEALEQLITYNFYDILGMAYILDWVFFRKIYGKEFLKAGKPRHFYSKKIRLSKKACRLTAKTTQGIHRYVKENISNFPRERLSSSDSYRVAGIDLGKRTGLCLLTGTAAETQVARTDDDIIQFVQATHPDLISIDAPLSLPKGRTSVYDNDPARAAGIMRYCERELHGRGVNSYPALIKSMQELTKRGIMLAEQFRRQGYPVIECFPGAAQDVVQLPRKRTDEALLKTGLSEFGIRGDFQAAKVYHDELDAITASLVGQFFISDYYEPLGIPEENDMIIPQKGFRTPVHELVIGLAGPVATGKTVAGRHIQAQGYRYIRYSEIIAEEIEPSGQAMRDELRREGWKLYSGHQQYALNKRLAAETISDRRLVVDGMRHCEDYTFWKEQEFRRFFLIYIDSNFSLRQHRFKSRGEDCVSYQEAISAPVEAHVEQLREKADFVIENNGSFDQLYSKIDKILSKLK